jgi:hypothetical protein
VLLDPSLKQLSFLVLPKLRNFMVQNRLGVLLPISVFFKHKETFELKCLDSSNRPSFAAPYSHNFTPNTIFFRLLRLMSEVFSQSFQLGLLQTQHGVASAPFTVNSLGLLNAERLLGGEELLHCF